MNSDVKENNLFSFLKKKLNLFERCHQICFLKSIIALGRIVILILFIYQTIDLTVNYLNYETVIDLKSERILQELPPITVCKTRFNSIGRIDCFINFENSSKISCSKVSKQIVSLSRFYPLCFTYFSQLIDDFEIKEKSRLIHLFIKSRIEKN